MKLKKSSEIMDEEKSNLKIENEKVDLTDFSSKNKKKNEWEDYHEKLLKVLKKEVKQIMEEVVTKKFVNEDSSSIVSLCAAIDSCLSHGLKRRALGLFKTNSTTALLQKMAKNCDEAAKVYKIVTEIEKVLPRGSSSSSDSLNKFRLSLIKQSNTSNSHSIQNTNSFSVNQQNNSTKINSPRYFWIRVALFEKHLFKIVEHLVSNSSIYYEKEALVSDLVNGQILISLLLGPCTLDYTKMKYQDQFWADPPADELVQRHNLISSPASSCSSSPLSKTMSNSRKAPLYLPYYKWFNFINVSTNNSNDTSSLNQTLETEDTDSSSNHPPLTQHLSLNSPFSPKEYVESLHQNYKTTLLYGKNNVWVQPNDDAEALAGYLSLHQNNNNLEIKWTPNQLMKGAKTNEENNDTKDKSSFWDYALIINVEETVYLHCHHSEEGGLAVFIGHDGVQKPPIRFPKGSHLLSFLTCLEAGLMPHGQLDPPLGLQKGKGKVFPSLKHRTKTVKKEKIKKIKSNDVEEDIELYKEVEKTTNDYVFRIITSLDKPESISEEMFNPKLTEDHFFVKKSLPWRPKPNLKQKLESTSSNSSTNSSKSLSEETYVTEVSNTKNSSSSIKTVCDTMKKQIVSRAFYGWLAHCRHLKTVRTHLSALVNNEIVKADDSQYSQGLTNQEWFNLVDQEGRIKDSDRLLKLVFFGYCEPSLRSKVWPFLLGHYEFNSTENERLKQDEEVKQSYELLITECLAVEAIVKQRDKENLTANLAKFTNEKNSKNENKNHDNENIEKSSNYNDFKNEDVIEENEDIDDLIDKNEEKNKNDKKINSKIENLKRQNNFCTQSSTQYASKQILITDASVDLCRNTKLELIDNKVNENIDNESNFLLGHLNEAKNEGQLSAEHSTCVSPASSNGGVYSNELLDLFSLNMHRIDKDVQRCDRNYSFFQNTSNLDKLRNIICTYVWKNLQDGYVQGMCDLVAPLLVILDNEMLAYSCFCELMKRMSANFPYQGLMDIHFANMRSLIQILDPELFKLMHSNGDYTHFYFCYRWFLLDFKREFNYEDVFKVWEVIWSGKNVASSNMVLFLALSLVQQYREIILENNMDFTDIIKFFNEMAERHDVNSIIENARQLVFQIQALIN